ncbi:NEL-type E3 ubiquitin ligase domain-containing protein [Undibacterium sp. CCC2.1]|uniref:NEL-type E3 ubiquitin ligase domain-containing protein n=7 Tax=Bacteria TaxID=2 RepID=UPI002B233562|nr:MULTISPECIES: NEL-type E3 ubiquitin ligase domain-containing protein [unclassified Undibacterium]MEB0141060.1 NEL-type E3 ubiquitin ligase domain-containing protein [Undibacterium sp. CCC2.1]MEB0174028.1 NEL-type E3 ubiquitin ligase domain-containing protein [Undibacterium sp. CCC1.1]MEB0217231.1 NEL-type E3 ubiquitin ligase domain-containing protein [Undibacterium sp. 5I2]
MPMIADYTHLSKHPTLIKARSDGGGRPERHFYQMAEQGMLYQRVKIESADRFKDLMSTVGAHPRSLLDSPLFQFCVSELPQRCLVQNRANQFLVPADPARFFTLEYMGVVGEQALWRRADQQLEVSGYTWLQPGAMAALLQQGAPVQPAATVKGWQIPAAGVLSRLGLSQVELCAEGLVDTQSGRRLEPVLHDGSVGEVSVLHEPGVDAQCLSYVWAGQVIYSILPFGVRPLRQVGRTSNGEPILEDPVRGDRAYLSRAALMVTLMQGYATPRLHGQTMVYQPHSGGGDYLQLDADSFANGTVQIMSGWQQLAVRRFRGELRLPLAPQSNGQLELTELSSYQAQRQGQNLTLTHSEGAQVEIIWPPGARLTLNGIACSTPRELVGQLRRVNQPTPVAQWARRLPYAQHLGSSHKGDLFHNRLSSQLLVLDTLGMVRCIGQVPGLRVEGGMLQTALLSAGQTLDYPVLAGVAVAWLRMGEGSALTVEASAVEALREQSGRQPLIVLDLRTMTAGQQLTLQLARAQWALADNELSRATTGNEVTLYTHAATTTHTHVLLNLLLPTGLRLQWTRRDDDPVLSRLQLTLRAERVFERVLERVPRMLPPGDNAGRSEGGRAGNNPASDAGGSAGSGSGNGAGSSAGGGRTGAGATPGSVQQACTAASAATPALPATVPADAALFRTAAADSVAVSADSLGVRRAPGGVTEREATQGRVAIWVSAATPDELAARLTAQSRIEQWYAAFQASDYQPLDLSNLGLTTMPRLPRELSAVDLSHNRLSMMPQASVLPPLLMQLDLSFNQIERLPTDWGSLVELDVRHNRIDRIERVTAPQLLRLQASNNRLTRFPEMTAPKLVEARLRSNEIRRLPVNMGGPLQSWPELLVLDLTANRLNSVPAGFGLAFPSLQRLALTRNRITALPAQAFQGMPHLRSLHLINLARGGRPVMLDDGVFDGLNELRAVALNRNSLEVLPRLPASLYNLRAEHNRLSQVGDLPAALISAELGYNRIASIDAQRPWPAGLQELSLDHNLLTEFPRNLPADMDHVIVSHNRIAVFDVRVTPLPVVTDPDGTTLIDLNDNPLVDIELDLAHTSDAYLVRISNHQLPWHTVEALQAMISRPEFDGPEIDLGEAQAQQPDVVIARWYESGDVHIHMWKTLVEQRRQAQVDWIAAQAEHDQSMRVYRQAQRRWLSQAAAERRGTPPRQPTPPRPSVEALEAQYIENVAKVLALLSENSTIVNHPEARSVVRNLLNMMMDDRTLLERLGNEMAAYFDTCTDGAAAMLVSVLASSKQVAIKQGTLYPDDFAGFEAQMQRFRRMDLLRKIADERIKEIKHEEPNFREDIEIALKFLVDTRQRLGLENEVPFTEMVFSRMVNRYVSAEHIERAIAQIQIETPVAYSSWMMARPETIAWLKKWRAPAYERLNTQLDAYRTEDRSGFSVLDARVDVDLLVRGYRPEYLSNAERADLSGLVFEDWKIHYYDQFLAQMRAVNQ